MCDDLTIFDEMDDNDDDPLGFLAEFKKGRYMSFSIDSSNLYLNEIPEGDYSDGKLFLYVYLSISYQRGFSDGTYWKGYLNN